MTEPRFGPDVEWFLGPDRTRIAVRTGSGDRIACWPLDPTGRIPTAAAGWTPAAGTDHRILGWAAANTLAFWWRSGRRTVLSLVDVAADAAGAEPTRIELLGRPVDCRVSGSGRVEVLVAMSTGTGPATFLHDPAAGSYLPIPGQVQAGGVAGWDPAARLLVVDLDGQISLVGYDAARSIEIDVRWPAGIRPIAAAGYGGGVVGLTGLDGAGQVVPGRLTLADREVRWFDDRRGYSAVDVGPSGRTLLAVGWDGRSYDYLLLDPAVGRVGGLPGTAGLATDLRLAADERHAVGWYQTPARPPAVVRWDGRTGRMSTVDPTVAPVAGASLRWWQRTAPDDHGPAVPEWVFEPEAGPARGTVVYLHGGPRGRLNQGYDPLIVALVDAGWRVVGPNYPGSSGYGAAYRDGTRGDWGGSDAAAVERRVRALHAADGGPIWLYGQSYGGYLALLVAARLPELLGGVAVWAPVTDLVRLVDGATGERRRWLAEELGALRSDPAGLRDRSPAGHTAGLSRTRLLIGHGGRDDRCPVEQSRLLVDLLGAGSVRYLEDPEGSHAPADWQPWIDAVLGQLGAVGAHHG